VFEKLPVEGIRPTESGGGFDQVPAILSEHRSAIYNLSVCDGGVGLGPVQIKEVTHSKVESTCPRDRIAMHDARAWLSFGKNLPVTVTTL
jgi:hypothetical protein